METRTLRAQRNRLRLLHFTGVKQGNPKGHSKKIYHASPTIITLLWGRARETEKLGRNQAGVWSMSTTKPEEEYYALE